MRDAYQQHSVSVTCNEEGGRGAYFVLYLHEFSGSQHFHSVFQHLLREVVVKVLGEDDFIGNLERMEVVVVISDGRFWGEDHIA